MSSNGNVRRIMVKHKRRAKCPLLKKFIEEALVPSEGNFLATEGVVRRVEKIGDLVDRWRYFERANKDANETK